MDRFENPLPLGDPLEWAIHAPDFLRSEDIGTPTHPTTVYLAPATQSFESFGPTGNGVGELRLYVLGNGLFAAVDVSVQCGWCFDVRLYAHRDEAEETLLRWLRV